MLSHLITWSLNHRGLVLFGSLILAAIGAYSATLLNVDAFPDTTPVQVQINTAATALVPEEVERLITFPVELSLGGLAGLQEVRSISQYGLSQVVATFDDSTNIYFARQLINERLSGLEIPPGISRPEMGPVSTGLGEVFHYVVIPGGEEPADLMALRTTQDWGLKPGLRTVPGTAEVNSWGGLKKQFQVRINPTSLFQHHLSFQQVMAAVEANNLNVGGGTLNRGGDALLVHGLGRTTSIEQIENIVITASDGVPIYVRDVAEVTIGHELRRGAVTFGGQGEGVLGLAFMRMGENSYAVTSNQREKLDEQRDSLPAGMQAVTVYDRTELVDQVLDTVRKNLLEGALLVVAILYIFLGSLRAGLICATTIPLSMLFAVGGMNQLAIAGTLLSLGAIDFGIVVDSSVVVLENVMKRLGHCTQPLTKAARLAVIRDAVVEVRNPTVFGQLIILIVYLPILSLEGIEGKMFRPMALTVMLVLVGSLIFSLTLTPVLASLVLPKHVEEKEVWLVRVFQKLYSPLLRLSLSLRWGVLAGAVAMVGWAGFLATNLGAEFVPRLSEGALVVGILRQPGTSLEESIRVNTLMEQALVHGFPDEVKHVWTRQGAPEVATDTGSMESGDCFITLTPRTQWKKATNQTELVELMSVVLAKFPGQTIWFTQPIEMRLNEMVSGVRADVALKIFGDDLQKLVDTGKSVEEVLRDVTGCVDLSTEQALGQPTLRVQLNQYEMARYGIAAETILDMIESVGGKQVGEVIDGQLRFPLVVRLPDHLRSGPETLAAIELAAPSGERVPLSRLAGFQEVAGPKLISREWGKRRITVQCNVRGRDIGTFVEEAQKKVAAAVPLEKGYRMEWGGQFENMQQAQQRLAIVVPLALLLIIGLLFLTYRNMFDTAFVFASVPFACVGGVTALWLREMPISISAAIGFITLSGVSVLSSMVLVASLRGEMKVGDGMRAALLRASSGSLRTVIMTALVASVGFIPMATSSGAGAEVQRPLATVVIGGVISSMAMTLFVLPVLYLIAERLVTRQSARSEPEPAPAELELSAAH